MENATRRLILGGSAATLLTGVAALGSASAKAQQPPAGAIDDDLVEAFLAESLNEGPPGVASNQNVVSWKELEADPALIDRAKTTIKDVASGKLVAKAVADAESPDYVRFATAECGKDGELCSDAFELSDKNLRSLAASNGYAAALQNKSIVLFGLRGCVLPGTDTTSASGESITVREAAIDHVLRRCLIGVWNTQNGHIDVYSGSTVPNLVNMQYYLYWRYFLAGLSKEKWTKGRTMACLLPQGLHTFTVGVHLRNESAARQQAGALLQTTKTPILRARNDVGYTLMDEWDPVDWEPGGSERGVRLVGVNIHAGVNHNMPPYASKGCQTIYGWYSDPATPAKLWKAFQEALGIDVAQDDKGKATFTKAGTRFPYMLSTGRELRMHASAQGDRLKLDALQRLRLGSKGQQAAALRKFLKLNEGDTLDGEAMLALLKWQKQNDLAPDGALALQVDRDWKIGAFEAGRR